MSFKFLFSYVRCLSIVSFLITTSATSLLAQKTIRGKIINQTSGEPVSGATVYFKENGQSTSSKNDGSFLWRMSAGISKITVLVTSVGFEDKEIDLPILDTFISIALKPHTTTLQEIVYTASRTPESILQSPVSVEKLNQKAIREMAGVNFHDDLRQIKGLDLVSTGLTYKQVNSRGFSSTYNWRFLQLIDDVDYLSPAVGWSYINVFTPSELDLESVELIPGAASALYGPVSFTGLLNIRTKDPFKHGGLAIQLKTGLNHIGESGVSPQIYKDLTLRFAKKVNEHIAFKFNIAYTGGLDFFANDSTDVNIKIPAADRGSGNPARDALNFYGDEIQKLIPGVGLVSRTGYREPEIAHYDVYTLRSNAALHFKLKGQSELIIQESYQRGNSNLTATSRYTLRNLQLLTSRIEWKGKHFFVRAYRQDEDMGDSYNVRALAQLMNRRWVRDLNGQVVAPTQADATWFSRYEAAYKGNIANIMPNSHQAARAFADLGRWIPGETEFERSKNEIAHTYQGKGAAYFSRSHYSHAEGQYAFNNLFRFADVLVGGNLRSYNIFTRGALFADSSKNIRYAEYGLFLRATKAFFDQKLKFSSSLRYDKNPGFRFNLSPRFSFVYEIGKDQFLRTSYQTGFRNPSTAEQYVYLRNGQLSLVGGVPQNTRGQNIYENGGFTTATVESFINAVSSSIAQGQTIEQAIALHRSELKLANVAYIRPELQHTVEIGYKGELFHRLLIDFNLDYSDYSKFSVNAYTTKPATPVLNSDKTINEQAIRDLLNNQYQNYQLYTNSSKKAHALFLSTGASHVLYKQYMLSANVTYARLYTSASQNMNEVAPFNTPEWSTNLSFSNPNIARGFGFKLNWHWQDAFDWYGTFNGNRPGRINAFSLVDFQMNKKFSNVLQLKWGASNLLNNRIAQTYGSPQLGSIFYVSFNWEMDNSKPSN